MSTPPSPSEVAVVTAAWGTEGGENEFSSETCGEVAIVENSSDSTTVDVLEEVGFEPSSDSEGDSSVDRYAGGSKHDEFCDGGGSSGVDSLLHSDSASSDLDASFGLSVIMECAFVPEAKLDSNVPADGNV